MAQVAYVMRQKIPFGIAQIGKAFRNEITPRPGHRATAGRPPGDRRATEASKSLIQSKALQPVAIFDSESIFVSFWNFNHFHWNPKANSSQHESCESAFMMNHDEP